LADNGESAVAATAAVWPVYSAGLICRGGVRSAALCPAEAAPQHPSAGWSILSGGGGGVFRFCPSTGGWRTAGLHVSGSCWGRRSVLLYGFRIFETYLGVLDGNIHRSVVFIDLSGAIGKKVLQKNGSPWKKSLLFCEQILYNKLY
jgi:hypothetical protein